MNSPPTPLQHLPLPTDLWRRLADGDERALRLAWLAHGGTAMALALRMLGSTAAAEALVAAVFADLWRQAPSEQLRRRSVEDWLVWAVWRRARSERGRRALPDAGTEALLPLESIAQRQRRRRLAQALARLPTEARSGLERAWFDGAVDTGVDAEAFARWLALLPDVEAEP